MRNTKCPVIRTFWSVRRWKGRKRQWKVVSRDMVQKAAFKRRLSPIFGCGSHANSNLEPKMATADPKMALLELIEQEADTKLVREIPAFAAGRMMDLEIEARTGAAAGTRSPDRQNHRNGYRERPLDPRAGRIDLAIPKLWKGSHFPRFLKPRRTAEKALPRSYQKPTSTAFRPAWSTTWLRLWGRRCFQERSEPSGLRDR